MPSSTSRPLAAALSLFALLAAPAAAHAHAHLRSASPAVDATVAASPPELAITYSQAVEPRFSTIEVQDGTGSRVDRQDPHTAPDDDKTLAVGLPPLPPGTYKVIWHATAIDTHRTEGTFTFTVKP